MDNTQLHQMLSAKSSSDLKDYIVHMSDGYTKEAVKVAISILKDRGENVDDLLRTAQVESCVKCKNRQVSKIGLICEITGEKADFIGTCSSYSRDESAAQEQERIRTEQSQWDGMMSFYWFVLAVGAGLTLVMGFYNLTFENGVCLALSDLVLQIGYAALCIYTIIAFAKRLSNAIMLGKMQNYTLMAGNSIVLIFSAIEGIDGGRLNSSIRLIGSVIWAAVFLSYIYTSAQIRAVFPKEKRHMLKYDKPIFWSIFGIVIALFIAGIFETAAIEARKPENELKSYVEQFRSTMTIDRSADSYCKGLEMENNTIIMNNHSTTYRNADLAPEVMEYLPIYTKELVFFYPQIDPILFEKCYAANYGISICWYDSNDEFTYSLDFSPEEVKTLCEEAVHHTSEEVWKEFLIGWNKQLPIEYLGDGAIYSTAEISGGMAVVNLTLQGVTNNELKFFTNEYLKSYLADNWDALTDHFITLAMLNGMEICYRFNVDFSSWSEEVIFYPEEYR